MNITDGHRCQSFDPNFSPHFVTRSIKINVSVNLGHVSHSGGLDAYESQNHSSVHERFGSVVSQP
jgi:hypothetical protein